MAFREKAEVWNGGCYAQTQGVDLGAVPINGITIGE
jgi:hypothetical protein